MVSRHSRQCAPHFASLKPHWKRGESLRLNVSNILSHEIWINYEEIYMNMNMNIQINININIVKVKVKLWMSQRHGIVRRRKEEGISGGMRI